jgi:hypothetical protein
MQTESASAKEQKSIRLLVIKKDILQGKSAEITITIKSFKYKD